MHMQYFLEFLKLIIIHFINVGIIKQSEETSHFDTELVRGNEIIYFTNET